MEKRLTSWWVMLVMLCLLASCASKKAIVGGTTVVTEKTESESISPAVKKLTFVQKVYDNQVYTKNIVGDMSFHIQYGQKEITVPGALRMRKDEVIRIQLFIPILGTEVARLEFTPEEVLIVDRMHKEYIQADYTKVDFLRDKGLTFYSLQALFWNQLFLPGVEKTGESDLKKFEVDLDVKEGNVPVSYQQGEMAYRWEADPTTGRILDALIKYQSGKHGTSSVEMTYGNFKSVGAKSFPAELGLRLSTTATGSQQNVSIDFSLDKVGTDSNWDTNTKISSKYKKVEPEDVLGKIMNL